MAPMHHLIGSIGYGLHHGIATKRISLYCITRLAKQTGAHPNEGINQYESDCIRFGWHSGG